MMGRRVGVAIAVLAIGAAACTSTISGTPTARQPTTPVPTVDPDPPAEPPSVAGARVESRRLGVHIVDPEDVLSDTSTDCNPTPGPYPTPEDTTTGLGVFTQDSLPMLKRAGYSAGWFSCYQQRNGVAGVVGAIEAYDDQRAAWLVVKMALKLFDPNGKRIELDGVPDATVSQYYGAYDNPIIQALVPHGRMVTYLWCDGGKTDEEPGIPLEQVRAACGTLLEAQDDELARFEPTPVDELGQLDDDPRHLSGEVIQPPGEPDKTDGGYTLEEYGRIADTPQVEVPLLDRHGLTEVYSRSGYDSTDNASRWVQLFELRDATAATKVYQTEFLVVRDWMRANRKNARQHVLGDVPDVRCHSGREPGYDNAKYVQQACIFTSGRYFFYVGAYNAAKEQADLTDIGKLVKRQLRETPR